MDLLLVHVLDSDNMKVELYAEVSLGDAACDRSGMFAIGAGRRHRAGINLRD